MSPGCQNCYAEAFAKRTGNAVWGKTADRRRFGDKHWHEPLRWDRAARDAGKPSLVFCASMADVFEDRDDHWPDRLRLWHTIKRTPHLEWQLLTKRPENVRGMVPAYWLTGDWPPNVWLGVTVEDQLRAEERIPWLQCIPAPVRFLSCEPLLGYVELGEELTEGVGWIIVGGESGPNHRPLDPDDARALRDEAERFGIPFLFKQHGGHRPTSGGDLLDGRQHKAFPARAQR